MSPCDFGPCPQRSSPSSTTLLTVARKLQLSASKGTAFATATPPTQHSNKPHPAGPSRPPLRCPSGQPPRHAPHIVGRRVAVAYKMRQLKVAGPRGIQGCTTGHGLGPSCGRLNVASPKGDWPGQSCRPGCSRRAVACRCWPSCGRRWRLGSPEIGPFLNCSLRMVLFAETSGYPGDLCMVVRGKY